MTPRRPTRSSISLLGVEPERGEIFRPSTLVEAMRYAALSPGKRIRSFLVIEVARLFGREDEGTIRAAAAIQCVHAFSLIHDDLPAVNGRDVRAGQPTVHRKFGEAIAVLAGDALLALAFDILADPAVDPDPLTCAALVGACARATGVGGMIGGQVLDLEAGEGPPVEEDIRRLQEMKTSALFRHACQAGALLGRASEDDRHRVNAFGEKFGLAYQLAYDLSDLIGDPLSAGNAGRKATLASFHGVDATRTLLAVTSAEAAAMMETFGTRGEILAEAARFVSLGMT